MIGLLFRLIRSSFYDLLEMNRRLAWVMVGCKESFWLPQKALVKSISELTSRREEPEVSCRLRLLLVFIHLAIFKIKISFRGGSLFLLWIFLLWIRLQKMLICQHLFPHWVSDFQLETDISLNIETPSFLILANDTDARMFHIFIFRSRF